MKIKISPNYTSQDYPLPWSFDNKIKIFEDRVYGWQLDIAEKCSKIDNSGYAVLAIVTSYFEMIAKFQEGYCDEHKSEEYFKKGVRSVFPELDKYDRNKVDKFLDMLYKNLRCGLYHQVFPNSVILTGDIKSPINFDPIRLKLIINPHKMVPRLKKHFENYISQLKGRKKELGNKFEQRFDYCDGQSAVT